MNVGRYGIVIGMVCGWSVVVPCLAADPSSQQQQSSPAASSNQGAATPATPQQRFNTLRAQLEGSTWALELTPEEGGKAQHDAIAFHSGKLSSESLSKSGFAPSNYSLSVRPDGVGVWETMQTDGKENTVFWRGELHGTTMRGAMNRRASNAATKSFAFAGTQTGAPPPPTSPPPSTLAPSLAPPSSPAASEPSASPAPGTSNEPSGEATTVAPAPSMHAPPPIAPAPTKSPGPPQKRKGWFGW